MQRSSIKVGRSGQVLVGGDIRENGKKTHFFAFVLDATDSNRKAFHKSYDTDYNADMTMLDLLARDEFSATLQNGGRLKVTTTSVPNVELEVATGDAINQANDLPTLFLVREPAVARPTPPPPDPEPAPLPVPVPPVKAPPIEKFLVMYHQKRRGFVPEIVLGEEAAIKAYNMISPSWAKVLIHFKKGCILDYGSRKVVGKLRQHALSIFPLEK